MKKYCFAWIILLTSIAMIFTGCVRNEVVAPTDAAISVTEPSGEPTEAPAVNAPDYKSAPGEADGYVHSYPLGTTVRYDLNGDGIGEDVLVRVNNDEDIVTVELTINGITVKANGLGDCEYYTVIHPDASKNTLLIGVSSYGSDDYWTDLYAYDGKNIYELGGFCDIVGEGNWGVGTICHGDGTITARHHFDVLGTWRGWGRYAVDGNSVRDITDFYSLDPKEENQTGWEVTTKVDVIMYEDINDPNSQIVVPAGTEVRMVGCKRLNFDDHWVDFEIESLNKTLWLHTVEIEWHTRVVPPDGLVDSEETFDGFFYAG